MNIALLTSSFPRYPGDYQGNFIWHQVRGQVIQGNSVHVICPHIPGTPLNEIIEGISVHRFRYFFPSALQRLSSDTGMDSALRHSLLAFLQLPLFFISQLYLTYSLIKRNKIDLIHTHWAVPSGFIGALLHCFTGIPHIMSIHGSDMNLLKKYPPLYPLCRFITKNSSLISVNSHYMKQQLLAVSPECKKKIKIIPMGVNIRQFTSPEHFKIRSLFPADYILFSVGRLIRLKGTIFLIRAMPRILSRFPSTRLLIAGDGPEREVLVRQVRDLGLNQCIHFLDFISPVDLPNYYHSADVFILPSINHAGRTEGLGVVLLEAMASGCPVVGTNVGGIPDIIVDGENGFLVPEQDSEILARKIIDLLCDKDLAEKFRLGGYETVRSRFSWTEISRQFAQEYAEVICPSKPSGAVP